jgi:predicted secreted hydrolase
MSRNTLHFQKILKLLIVGIFISGCTSPIPKNFGQTSQIEWANIENINTNHFDHADQPRVFSFPVDHGAHQNFQTEWWYFTGNLKSEQGDDFGYQLTFFRRALQPQVNVTNRTSDLAVNQIYMAHFTITQAGINRFYPFQRFNRGDNQLAGALTDPFLKVWLADWQVQQISENEFQLKAQSDGIEIDLSLSDGHGIILQGDMGLSHKSSTTASYYYSMPRLTTKGSINIEQKEFRVTGTSWMDHEFSTSALSGDQIGWDWFALHLDDGKDIMAYRMRNLKGSLDPNSNGSLLIPSQPLIGLAAEDFNISSTGSWKSPTSNAVYPSGWHMLIPSQGIDLTITPLIKDQELNFAFTYWEGAVLITGSINGKSISGSGYVELTGYAHSMQGQF